LIFINQFDKFGKKISEKKRPKSKKKALLQPKIGDFFSAIAVESLPNYLVHQSLLKVLKSSEAQKNSDFLLYFRLQKLRRLERRNTEKPRYRIGVAVQMRSYGGAMLESKNISFDICFSREFGD
jgi:hypothetical protein